MQCRQHAHQNLPYFAEWGLLVIERIEQSKNQGGMDMLSPANFRQPVYNGLFHLIAGEASRNEDAAQEIVGVAPFILCEPDDRVRVEPVPAVRHHDMPPFRHHR